VQCRPKAESESLGGTEGLMETVQLVLRRRRNVCDEEPSANASGEWVPYCGRSNSETAGSKGCVDPRDRQQIWCCNVWM